MNDYYVYIYWRLDTNEPFYVGKGKERRWKDLCRKNPHFKNIIDKYPTIVTIEKDNLTEQEAFYWEEKIIEELVFEYGFSINIKGNNSNNHYCHLVNRTWGGEGNSGIIPSNETKRKMSNAQRGNKNHMYGKHHTKETRKKMSEIRTEKCKQTEFKKILSELNSGKNNPMYGRKGKNSPHAKSVICLTTKRIFFSAKEGAVYYNCDKSHIGKCCKGKYKHCGKLLDGTKLVWKWLVWKHNKKYRIKGVK